VANAGIKFRKLRSDLRQKHNKSFRELYQALENPGEHPLKKAQFDLDKAVRAAYGMKEEIDPLAFLLDLNFQLSNLEAEGKIIQKPGLPDFINDRASYVTDDCVSMR
jgi:hypothetical protein